MEHFKNDPSAEPLDAPETAAAPAPQGADDMTRVLPATADLPVSEIVSQNTGAGRSSLKPLETLSAPKPTPQPAPEPTKAERPVRKRRRWYHRLGKVGLFLLKWIVALVLAATVLAGGLLGYLTITEYRPAYAEKADSGVSSSKLTFAGDSLRLLTFNTGYGGLGREADSFLDGGTQVNPASEDLVVKNMLGVEDILIAARADVLLLQEVDTESDRSFGRNQWQQYAYDLDDYETRFALNYSCQYVPYPLKERIGKVNSGVATFSRYDISSATRYSLPVPFEWPVRVANLKRCLLVTRLPIEGSEQELVIVNLHLEAYDDGEGKAAQTEALMALLEEEYAKGNYVIAGGDFNQTFPGAEDAYPLKESSQWAPGTLDRLSGGWEYAYDDSTPTCRLLNQPYDEDSALTQYYVIDGFIVSPNVQITAVETLSEDFAYSDHNPVVLEVKLLTD